MNNGRKGPMMIHKELHIFCEYYHLKGVPLPWVPLPQVPLPWTP